MNSKLCFPFRKWTMRRLPVSGLALGMLALAAVMMVPAQSNAQTHVISVKSTESSITAGETASFFLELTTAPGISQWPRHNLKVTWSPPGLVKSACGDTPANVATAISHTCTAKARFKTNETISSTVVFDTDASKLDGSNGWIKVSADTNQSFSGNYTPSYNSAEETATVDVIASDRIVFNGWNKNFDGTVVITGEQARTYPSYRATLTVTKDMTSTVEFQLSSQKNKEETVTSNPVVLSTNLTEQEDFSLDFGRELPPPAPETIKVDFFPSNGNGITGLAPGDTRTYTLIFTIKNSSTEVVDTKEVTVIFSYPVQSIDFNGWNNNFDGTVLVTGGSLSSYDSYSAQLPVTKTDDATVEFQLESQKNDEQKEIRKAVPLSTIPTRPADFVVSFGSGNQQNLERINIGLNPSLGIGIFGLIPGETRTYTLIFNLKNSVGRVVDTEKIFVTYDFPSQSGEEPTLNVPTLSISGTGGAVEGEQVLLFTIMANAADEMSIAEKLDVNYTVTETGGFLASTVVKGRPVSKELNFRGSGNVRSAQLSLQLAPDDPIIKDNSDVTVTLNADPATETSYIVSRMSGTATQPVYDNDGRESALFISASSESITEGESVEFFVRTAGVGSTEIILPVRISQQGEFVLWHVPDQITVPANSSVGIKVYTDNDRMDETNGKITFTLPSVPNGYRLGSKQSLDVNVFDNDTDETPQEGFSVAGLVIVDIIESQQTAPRDQSPVISITTKNTDPIDESAGNAVFTLTSTPAPKENLTVRVNVSESGSVIGSKPEIVEIPMGESEFDFSVPLVDDRVNESDSTVTVTVQSGSNYARAQSPGNEAVLTVSDNDQIKVDRITNSEPGRKLNREILPDLLASTSGHSMETVTDRIDFASYGPGRVRFEFNGSSSPDDMISRAGDMASNGNLNWEDIRNGSSFAVPLILGESESPMTFWGSGFGKEIFNDENSRFDWKGETSIGHLGLDATVGKGLLVGMVASSDESSVDFELERHKGTYDVRMSSFNPYLAWSNQDMSTQLKFSAGYGVGEVEFDYEDQSPETADSHRHSILIGIRDKLASLQNPSGYRAGLALDTEFRLARQFVKDNGEGIAGTGIANRSLNSSLEGTLEKTFASGSVLRPFATASTKWRGGSHEPGAELDLTSGMEFTSLSGFRISGSNYIQLIGESDRKHELEGSLEFDSISDRSGVLLDSSFAYEPINNRFSSSMGIGYGFNPESRIRLGLSIGDISSRFNLNSQIEW